MIDHMVVLIDGLESSDKDRTHAERYAKPGAIHSGDAYIDIELAWLVRRLNYMGVKTLYCCQGGQEVVEGSGIIHPGYMSYFGWNRDGDVKYEIESALNVEVQKTEHDYYPLTMDRRTYMCWEPK